MIVSKGICSHSMMVMMAAPATRAISFARINLAAPVKGPAHVETPVLSVEDARSLLDSIPTDSLQGLRDRALIGGIWWISFRKSFN
jgi:hypothetical protein